jgi:hypothetical protein
MPGGAKIAARMATILSDTAGIVILPQVYHQKYSIVYAKKRLLLCPQHAIGFF